MSEQDIWSTSVFFAEGGLMEIKEVTVQKIQEGVMLVGTKDGHTYGFPLATISYWVAR